MMFPHTYKKLALGALLISLVAPFVLSGAGDYGQTSLFVDDELEAKRELSMKASIQVDANKPHVQELDCDVVVVGGGSGGFAAALSAARMNVKTCLVEESKWLGGMLTAAGVSGIDGHTDTPSGIFKEFVDRVSQWYAERGRFEETQQCGVSYFCFEPHVGNNILQRMLSEEKNLKVYLNAEVKKVYREGNTVKGVNFVMGGKEYLVRADVTVDATEFGDLMYLADIPFDLGVDEFSSKDEKKDLQCVQPLTYVALLKYYGDDMQIKKPNGYYEENYECVTKNEGCPDSNSLFTKERLLNYGRLPAGKLMLNIPSHSYGNDFDASNPQFDNLSRDEILKKAKNYTLGLVYYLQTRLGFDYYGLYNEFGSSDNLALMPYVRESRRLVGAYRLTKADVMPSSGRAKVFKDSIAIGDYPIDLHFCSLGYGDIYFPIPPYQIPYGVTYPEEVDGFMVAEKNISVGHLVNGTTRLQPVVMSVGQGVGVASALASKYDVQPRDLDVAEIQEILLNQGSGLFYFADLDVGQYSHKAVSKLALRGVVVGYSDLKFIPSKKIKRGEFVKMVNSALESFSSRYPSFYYSDEDSVLSRGEVARFLATELLGLDENSDYLSVMVNMGIISNIGNFKPSESINRADAAVMLVRTLESLGAGF